MDEIMDMKIKTLELAARIIANTANGIYIDNQGTISINVNEDVFYSIPAECEYEKVDFKQHIEFIHKVKRYNGIEYRMCRMLFYSDMKKYEGVPF